MRDSALPILQCALAAGLAFGIARHGAGHPVPFFAPIACVLVLGISLTNRLRRSVELAVGVSVGVAVGDAIVLAIGTGWWQIAVVVALTLAVALLCDVGPLLLNQAAVSAVLVATLQPPGSAAAFSRWIDTLIGAGVGLAVAALVPSNPSRAPRRSVDTLLGDLQTALTGAATTLRDRDLDAGRRVLDRVRATQSDVDALETAVGAGWEVTTLAPLRRRHRGELARLRTAATYIDLALRNARVLVRRVVAAVEDAEPAAPELAGALEELADATATIRTELTRGEPTDGGVVALHDLAARLPADADGFSTAVALAQLRSVVADLLTAAGEERDTARASSAATRDHGERPGPEAERGTGDRD